MKTRVLAAMFAAMLMVSAIGGTAFAGKPLTPGPDHGASHSGAGQVTVCHNDRLISVSANAEAAHAAHGDPALVADACPV